MLTRRSVLAALAASLLFPRSARAKTFNGAGQEALTAALRRPDTLGYAASKRGIMFGSLADHFVLPGGWGYDAAYSETVLRECSLLICLNLSPHATRKARARFDFTAADREIAFAESNGKAISGGYLAVHDSAPSWISASTDRASALAELQTIITATMRKYSGKLSYWIVANEAIKVSDGNPYGLHNCNWRASVGGDVASGTDYVTESFRAARAADPNATLIYNDYGIEDGDRASSEKRAAVVTLLASLRRAGLIDGLGIQAHLMATSTTFDPGLFSGFLDAVHALGLDIMITEMDVDDKGAPADIPMRDAIVSARYASFLQVALNHPGVRSLVVWGLADPYSWLNAPWFPQFARADRLPQRPDLLDAKLTRKPAYFATRAAFGA